MRTGIWMNLLPNGTKLFAKMHSNLLWIFHRWDEKQLELEGQAADTSS